MKRAIDQILKQWKDSRVRQPLLIRGARQVGKTYSVTEFGRTAFENTVSVNFEEQPELSRCFSAFAMWDALFFKKFLRPNLA